MHHHHIISPCLVLLITCNYILLNNYVYFQIVYMYILAHHMTYVQPFIHPFSRITRLLFQSLLLSLSAAFLHHSSFHFAGILKYTPCQGQIKKKGFNFPASRWLYHYISLPSSLSIFDKGIFPLIGYIPVVIY